MAGRYLPVHTATVVDSMSSRAYIGQFSPCGEFFVGAFQDSECKPKSSSTAMLNIPADPLIRGAATAPAPPHPLPPRAGRVRLYEVGNKWRVKKDVICRLLRWTVTDTAISPDNRFLVYSSITPIVHLVNVGNESAGVESLGRPARS